MAARLQLTHSEKTKSKIQTSMLVIRLQSHALGKLKHPMTASQIRCAEILLNKTLPNLGAIQVEAEIDHEITIKWQK
jgi:hypothetical protein